MAAKASTEQRPPMNADQTPGDQTVPHTKSPQPQQVAKRRPRVNKGRRKGSKVKAEAPATDDAEAAAASIIPLSDTAK